jgi:hypothetical protein
MGSKGMRRATRGGAALISYQPGTEKCKKVAAAAGGNTVDLIGQR